MVYALPSLLAEPRRLFLSLSLLHSATDTARGINLWYKRLEIEMEVKLRGRSHEPLIK